MTVRFLIFFVLLAMAAAWDVRHNRIPNRLTLAGIALGVGLAVVDGTGWTVAVAGAAAGLLITLPFFLLGAIGGGDAKLLMAIGAFLGPLGLLDAALYAGVLGGAMALFEAVRRGVILPVLLRARDLAVYGLTLGRRGHRGRMESRGAVTIPYGVPLAAGALAAWFLPIAEGALR